MPLTCPECHQQSGAPLMLTRLGDAEYFECADCGHVWKQLVPVHYVKKSSWTRRKPTV